MVRDGREKRISGVDIAAFAVCLLLFGYLFYSVGVGIGLSDEHWYFTMPQRFLQGDRIFVDDWHVTQLSAVVQLLPYRLYTLVAGGTDGVLLFMRRLFVVFDLFCYWFYYLKLRRYGVAALAGAALMCSYVHLGAFTFSYTALPPHFLALAGTLLVAPEKQPSPPALTAAGVLLSCAVLCQPSLAAVFAVFFLLALLRFVLKRRGGNALSGYDFILGGKVPLYLALTAAVCAGAVVCAVLLKSGLRNILDSLPEIFSDSEYRFSAAGNTTNAEKLRALPKLFGAFNLVSLCALIPIAALLRRSRRFSEASGALLFPIACALTLSAYAFELRYYFAHPEETILILRFATVPLLPFALICRLLQKQRDRRMFFFWWLGLFASAAVDPISHITLGFGGRLAVFSAAHSVCALLREFPGASGKEAVKSKKNPIWRAVSARAALLLVCALLCADGLNFYAGRSFRYNDRIYAASRSEPLTERLDAGPLKGIRTTESYRRKYGDMLADLDTIRTSCTGAVYVAEKNPWFYLYLDLPIGAPTAMFIDGNSTDRVARYWQTHPDKRPEYVYVQQKLLTEKQLSFLKSVCSFETRNGKAGFLLRIKEWKI
ncbi:MAG: hypothetical protein IJL26_00260 [Clostridia bacterium]|nr:hypothetical protein [Clostridia bacterium]